MSANNKALIKTILTSGFAVIMSYLINFFVTPFITDHVGTEAYGFVTFAKTAASYAAIITVAFTVFIVRYITLAYHKNNYEEAIAYYSSSIAAVDIISAGILLLALVFAILMPEILSIPEHLHTSVQILFVLVFINFCINTITVPYTATFYIQNTLNKYQLIKSLSYIVEAVALFVLFSRLDTKLWYVGIGLIAASLTVLLGSMSASRRYTPEIQFSRSAVSLHKVTEMARNGIWQSLNAVGTTLNHGLDLLVSNQLLSSLIMGQLSITKNICMIFSVMHSTISQAFQPRMLKAYASSDMQGFMNELKLAMRVSGFFSACIFAGFFSLGELYYRLWLPNQDHHLLYVLTIISVFGGLGEGIIYPAFYVNTLTTRKKIPCLVTIGNGLLNVLGMFILITRTNMGVYAVILTTTVLTLLNSIVFSALYCPYTLKLPWYTLYPVILRHLAASAVLCLLFRAIAAWMVPNTWGGLIFCAVLMMIFGIVAYVAVVASSDEMKRVSRKILKRR